MNIPQTEKRRVPRVPLNMIASLRVERPREIPPVSVVIANVSEKGMALQGQVQLSVGDLCRMRLCLPDGKFVEGSAEIVWKDPSPSFISYGARLVEISWWSRRMLRSYIHAYDGPGALKPDLSRRIAVCLALSAGVVWYDLIQNFGTSVVYLGVAGALAYLGLRLKPRRD